MNFWFEKLSTLGKDMKSSSVLWALFCSDRLRYRMRRRKEGFIRAVDIVHVDRTVEIDPSSWF